MDANALLSEWGREGYPIRTIRAFIIQKRVLDQGWQREIERNPGARRREYEARRITDEIKWCSRR
jgi:hypothetical protein